MDLLEHYHTHPPENEYFVRRKRAVPLKGNVNIFGARGCGKTALALAYIKEEEAKTFYIDLEEPNLILNTLDTLPLQAYLDESDIEVLILDHYEPGMLESFPRVERLIVISRIPLDLEGFEMLQLFPLDYEEFLAFTHAASDTVALNHFLKLGTLPVMAKQKRETSLQMKQFFQQQFTPNEQALILMLAHHNTQPLTVHQIYTFTKEHFRISKDFVYSCMKRFEEEGLIYFIENALKRSGRKMIMYDFAFVKYLTVQQPFGTQFDTMIALALIKHRIPIRTLGIHGYLTDKGELIIPAAFESEESFWIKAQNKFSLYKKYEIQKVMVVTVSNTYAFDIEKLHFEALPFNEWSVINDEEED